MNIKTKRILLIIDDEQDVLNSLRRVFEREYRVKSTSKLEEAYQILEFFPVSVILCDQKMPEMSGTEFFKSIKNKYPNIVKLILTGYSSMEDAIAAVNEGDAFRYLQKPWNIMELKVSIKEAFERVELTRENERMIKELKELNKKLEEKVEERTKEIVKKNEALRELNKDLRHMATIDVLTGLHNRRMLDEMYTQKLHTAIRLNVYLAITMIDLNRFKEVNDQLGHKAGDDLLVAFSKILKDGIREGLDSVFRVGGDEFLILSLDCDMEGIRKFMNRMKTAFREETKISSISYGAVLVEQDKNISMEDWINIADNRLYENKNEQRRQRYEYYNTSV